MPRKNLIRTDLYPYHITARSNNKEAFDMPSMELWPLLEKLIKEAEGDPLFAEIPCYVLMKNHFHLLIWTTHTNIDRVMHFLMKRMADAINKQSQRINHAFGGPYKWCLIRNENYYANVIRYICQNPLRANLCEKVEDYPYLHIPSFDLVDGHQSQVDFLQWLNLVPDHAEMKGVKKGLQKREFKVSLNPENKKPYF